MTLSDVADMTNSGSLRARIYAAAALAGKDATWANTNTGPILATTGWEASWSSALAAADARNHNPDTGIRTDVITDQMITDAVTALTQQAGAA